MKCENKHRKAERATFLKDQITVKKEKSSKGRKIRLLVTDSYTVEQISDTKIQSVAYVATGGISLSAGVLTSS